MLTPPKKRKVSTVEEEAVDTPVVKREEAVELGVEVADIQRKISKMLKYSTYEPEQYFWLDTGSPALNAALGSRRLGMPYGKIYELRGPEHGGKTTLATVLGGMAQKDEAAIGYIDLERSGDPQWAARLGLDFSKVLWLVPKLVVPKKKSEEDMPRLQSAEQSFEEAEIGMAEFARRGYKKQFWLLDSVANIQTEMAIEAAYDRNMRVNVDRAQFLSYTLPKWAGLAANYNAMFVLINQIRTKVGVVFGNPEYSPGGHALAHACSIRANVRRTKGGGTLRVGEKIIGISSKVVNFKNKAGEGSVEQESAAFKIRWNKVPAKIEFMSVQEAEEE